MKAGERNFQNQLRRERGKQKLGIWSSLAVILISGAVLLTSCGATTANRAEQIPAKKATPIHSVAYTVQEGDTLTGISAKFADKWQADTPLHLIAESIKEKNANRMPNGYVLQAGSEIQIPVWK